MPVVLNRANLDSLKEAALSNRPDNLYFSDSANNPTQKSKDLVIRATLTLWQHIKQFLKIAVGSTPKWVAVNVVEKKEGGSETERKVYVNANKFLNTHAEHFTLAFDSQATETDATTAEGFKRACRNGDSASLNPAIGKILERSQAPKATAAPAPVVSDWLSEPAEIKRTVVMNDGSKFTGTETQIVNEKQRIKDLAKLAIQENIHQKSKDVKALEKAHKREVREALEEAQRQKELAAERAKPFTPELEKRQAHLNAAQERLALTSVIPAAPLAEDEEPAVRIRKVKQPTLVVAVAQEAPVVATVTTPAPKTPSLLGQSWEADTYNEFTTAPIVVPRAMNIVEDHFVNDTGIVNKHDITDALLADCDKIVNQL